jgi:arylsulfatase I/J
MHYWLKASSLTGKFVSAILSPPLLKSLYLSSRHYVFRWCAPTRSALMTGRLPYHVLQNTNHVAREMTMIPAKLKQVGYKTHQIGE